MTIQLQEPCVEGQLHPADSMNVNLLTILSKLVIALVLGIVVMII